MQEKTIGVIGSGSWATALTKVLNMNGHKVRWLVRNTEMAEFIHTYHHNPKYLSSAEFTQPVSFISTDVKEVVEGCTHILLATPSAYLKDTIAPLRAEDFKNKKIISAIKGIVQPENLLVSLYFEKNYGVVKENFANISGPCHAEEVAAEKLSYLTFSSPLKAYAEEVAAIFGNRILYTRSSTDLYGTEYASVMKNVYALANGISIGLGYGDNFRAVLVTAGMYEMNSFLDAVCPTHRHILTPPYLGDTLVTSYSQYSRNRTFGLMIGKGYSVNSAILELNMVAEGYYATKALKQIAAEKKQNLPILNAAYNILYEKYSAAIEFRVLAEKIG